MGWAWRQLKGKGWHWLAGRLQVWFVTTASGTWCCGYCMCWQWVRALVMWLETCGSFLVFILPNPFLCHWADSFIQHPGESVFRWKPTTVLRVNTLLCYCKLLSFGLPTLSFRFATLYLYLLLIIRRKGFTAERAAPSI